MRPAIAILAVLFWTAGPASAQSRTHQVINNGEKVEIIEISTRPAPAPKPFFKQLPPQVLSSTLTVSELARRYTEEFRKPEQARLLRAIAKTKPETDRDIRAILNLYNRYPRRVRATIQRSMSLLTPQDAHFDPFFTMLIRQPDASFQAFGMLGALQIRSEGALPLIRRIAARELDRPDFPDEVAVTLQALRVLAAWKAPESLDILRRQMADFPELAQLLARYYWSETFDSIVRWSESRKEALQERARAAWTAEVPVEELRKTRTKLKNLVLDEKAGKFVRHQASIKLGLASIRESEVDELLSEHEKAEDDMTRLYLTTSVFATRHKKAIPLLVEHVKTHPSPINRAGALAELKDLMEPADYAELLRWMKENDPDRENRDLAETELSLLSAGE